MARTDDIKAAINNTARENIVGIVYIDQDGNAQLVDMVDFEGEMSIRTVSGHHDVDMIHLGAFGLSADEGFMLIDLNNVAIWPHTNTDHIDIEYIIVDLNPSTAFRGDVVIGFLTDVDDTNGDLNVMIGWHFTQGQSPVIEDLQFSNTHFEATKDHWLGLTVANDTKYNTGATLTGPNGNTYPAADGDLVCDVNRTAGTIEIGITIGYETRA